MPYLRFNFTFKLARFLRQWRLGVSCLDTSGTIAQKGFLHDKERMISSDLIN
jgi:hypothetical protein